VAYGASWISTFGLGYLGGLLSSLWFLNIAILLCLFYRDGYLQFVASCCSRGIALASPQRCRTDIRNSSSHLSALKSTITIIELALAILRSMCFRSSELEYRYLALLSIYLALYQEAELAETQLVNWVTLRWIAAILFQSDGKILPTLSCRPLPRGRRRSCASACKCMIVC